MDLLDAAVDPETLTRRADELLGAQRLDAARTLMAAAQLLTPSGQRMSSLAARMEMRGGHLSASIAALGQAIAVAPRAELFMLRADARQQLGDMAGAAADAAEAVIHDRHDPAAKALLGVLMIELGRPEDAVRCLAEAVAAYRRFPGVSPGPGQCAVGGGPARRGRRDLCGRDRRGTGQPGASPCATPPSCWPCASANSTTPPWRSPKRHALSGSPMPAPSDRRAMRCPAWVGTRKPQTLMPTR